MRQRYALLYIIGAFLLLVACTEVDLCRGDHPHRSDLRVYFDFGNAESVPDSMVVFAVRNLNLLRYTFLLNSDGRMSTPATGHLIFPDELREQAYTWVDSLDADSNIVRTDTFPDSPPYRVKKFTGNDSIRLHPGDYELVAFSSVHDVYYDNLEEVMNSDAQNVDSLWVTHVSYHSTNDHPSLKRDSSWVSHNLYSDFILNGDRMTTYAAQETVTLPIEEQHHFTDVIMHADNLSQHVTLEFCIEKDDSVIVDSVVAELSGIPYRYYLMTGMVDVERTFKTIYRPDVIPANNANTEQVTVRGDLYVNGIVHSADPAFTTGPGILWVNVYVRVFGKNGSGPVSRPIVACINLYNLLKDNPSLRLNDLGEPHQTTKELFLQIPTAILDLDRWALTSQETSGLDVWHTLPNDDDKIGVDL